jgi:hypothetical protein
MLVAGQTHPWNLMGALTALGLTSGLKVCLDTGDGQSYSSGQSWLDRSGNGYDFFLGATGSAAGDDPTFNGTPNKYSSGEYFAYDGGDFFRYDSANETWMQNLHKDNAKFSLIALCFMVPASSQVVFATANLDTQIGVRYSYGTSGHNILVANGSGSPALSQISVGLGATDNAWHMLGISIDEAVGASGAFHYRNGSTGTFTSTYTSPSASSATSTAEIGAAGGVGPATSGSRIGALAMWEGVTPLTIAQMNAIRTAVGGRVGV